MIHAILRTEISHEKVCYKCSLSKPLIQLYKLILFIFRGAEDIYSTIVGAYISIH